MKILRVKLREIISDRIHIAKCSAPGMPHEAWKAIDSSKIAEESIEEIVDMIEAWLFLPCCHTSGMHNPEHFAKREYICGDQKAEALTRFCLDLDINPVTKSCLDCLWCHDYKHYRKGEGLHLFENPIEGAKK